MVTMERWPWRNPWTGYRLVVVAGVVVALVRLAQLSQAELARPALLGVRAGAVDEQMVVTWVEPEGLGWDAGLRPGDRLVAVDGRPVSARDDPAIVGRAGQIAAEAPSGARRAGR